MKLVYISPSENLAVTRLEPVIYNSKLTAIPAPILPQGHRERIKKAKDLQFGFSAALVHEVRNPLTNINLAIEMLEASLKDDDLKIYMDIIRRSSTRINDLITDLLSFPKPEIEIVEKHSIHRLLDEVLRMAEDRIALKQVLVWTDYSNHDFKINLNREKTFIGLTNIVINAIDAMTLGNGQLTVTTTVVTGKYLVTIEDNGCGISDENMKKIGKPYFSNKPGGLGLGLASTYNIFRENNVAIKAESVVGKGTRFILSFEDDSTLNGFKNDEMN